MSKFPFRALLAAALGIVMAIVIIFQQATLAKSRQENQQLKDELSQVEIARKKDREIIHMWETTSFNWKRQTEALRSEIQKLKDELKKIPPHNIAD